MVAVLAAVKLSVLLLLVLAELNCAVTPEGRPETARTTVPENPFLPATVIVLELEPPVVSATLEEDADSVKLGVPTVTVIAVEADRLPEVPLIVSE